MSKVWTHNKYKKNINISKIINLNLGKCDHNICNLNDYIPDDQNIYRVKGYLYYTYGITLTKHNYMVQKMCRKFCECPCNICDGNTNDYNETIYYGCEDCKDCDINNSGHYNYKIPYTFDIQINSKLHDDKRINSANEEFHDPTELYIDHITKDLTLWYFDDEESIIDNSQINIDGEIKIYSHDL